MNLLFLISTIVGFPVLFFRKSDILNFKHPIFENMKQLCHLSHCSADQKYYRIEHNHGLVGLAALFVAKRQGKVLSSDKKILNQVWKMLNWRDNRWNTWKNQLRSTQSYLQYATDQELQDLLSAATAYLDALLRYYQRYGFYKGSNDFKQTVANMDMAIYQMSRQLYAIMEIRKTGKESPDKIHQFYTNMETLMNEKMTFDTNFVP